VLNSGFLPRNAYTGEIVDPGQPPDPTNPYEVRRVRRLLLQSSLAARVPPGLIQFNKKLVSVRDLGKNGVEAVFEDGTATVVDLVVGADGIRSVHILLIMARGRAGTDWWQVVRKHIDPDFPLNYARRSESRSGVLVCC
jgi:salicylate hydroxylase